MQSQAHDGQECNIFTAYALSKKGKATSNVTYNPPEDGADSYSSPTAYQRIREYTEMARQVHGSEYDPTVEDIDGEVLMRVGGGKKHGQYFISDSAIDPTTTPTLSELRARSTDASPSIRPRVPSSQLRFQQLEEETRLMKVIFIERIFTLLKHNDTWVIVQEQLLQERRERAEERAEWEARMGALFTYMQTYSQQQGGPQPPPEIMMPPHPPPGGDVFTTPVSPLVFVLSMSCVCMCYEFVMFMCLIIYFSCCRIRRRLPMHPCLTLQLSGILLLVSEMHLQISEIHLRGELGSRHLEEDLFALGSSFTLSSLHL
jgi:hypothetical protein